MPPKECAERAHLSRIAAHALDELSRAKAAYDTAKRERAENVSALGLVLSKAREAERAAARVLAEHITAHGCQHQRDRRFGEK
jgi:hypothetical protein